MSAEYIMAGGNHQVILCERGIRTFETFTRNTLDLSAVLAVKKLSHLPVVVDPSHACGQAWMVERMSLAAVAVCDDPDLFDCKGFEGGSFRDCTRVAALDVPLWTELFSMNAPALCTVIRTLEDNLRAYREVIESGDTQALAAKLAWSADRKRHMNLE